MRSIRFTDSIAFDIKSTYTLTYNTIKSKTTKIDSAVLIFDYESKSLYTIDFGTKKIEKLKINRNRFSNTMQACIDDNLLYTLELDNRTITQGKIFSDSFKSIRLSNTVYNNYYAILNPFQCYDNNFVLHKIPNLNILNDSQRTEYFKSTLVINGEIANANWKEQNLNVTFPSKYQTNYYNDLYPLIAVKNPEHYVYVYAHTDTIFLYNQVQQYILIPSKYSVQSPPYQDVGSSKFSEDMEYSVTHASNYKILYASGKIYLFQKLKEMNTNEKGELISFDSAQKRILVYDINLKKFTEVYSIPKTVLSQFSFLYNDNVIMPSAENQNLVLYVADM